MSHKVKVISLERSIERRKIFAERNGHIDFEFFDAIEGTQIMPELNNAPDLFESGLRYNAGAVGCAMSHLMLWQEAADTNRALTIAEDDAILRHDFHKQAARAIEQLPADWDIVVWAWNFDSILSLNAMSGVSHAVMLFDQAKMRTSVESFQTMTDVPLLPRLDKCFGTPCYTISPSGARKFMRNCFPLQNFQLHFPVLNRALPNNGIDIAMNRIYGMTLSYCSLPPLALTPNEHATSLVQNQGDTPPPTYSGVVDAPPTDSIDPSTLPGRDGEERIQARTIPRVVHRIWFGEKPIPEAYEKYWEAWQRQLPDFEFRTWRDHDVVDFQTSHKIANAEGMARKADIARYEILLRHGGIYLDCDIYPYQRFEDSLLDNELVVCNESADDNICSIGFIAAKPGAQALAWIVNAVLQRELNRCPPNEETGPWLFREALRHGSHKRLPTASFYPYLFNEPFSTILNRDLSSTYGIHVWGGSWLTDSQKLIKVLDRVQHGDLEETIQLSSSMEGEGHHIHEYANGARNARQVLLEAAKHQILNGQLKIENDAPLELAKAGFFMMQQLPDALIWQIGAADGILVDPLRALMVNFDPKAVLVEPNPYMHAKLLRNYRNNQRTKFVQAALGANTGKMTLNAINPEKVEEKGLPSWALGISSAYTDRNAIGGLTIDADMTRRIGECLESINVDVIDVEYLLSLHDGVGPAAVVIDVEGMDAQIVKLILEKDLRPFILQFEVQCLPAAELEQVMALLHDEYVCLRFGHDIVAYRKVFLTTYCEHLYVENGIHTIYRQAIKFVSNIV